MSNLQDLMNGEVEYALLRLWSDGLSTAEAAAIRRRVRNDPKYGDELHGSLAILAAMEGLADDPAVQEVVPDIRRLIQRRRSRRSAALGMAAGMLVAIGAVLAYVTPWSGPVGSRPEVYATGIGEQRTIRLDDGSQIAMNTASRLAVDYNERVRAVRLERGEAHFDVADDPERPFSVDLGARSVTALGTAFNVRKTPERYEVAVFEGAIAFHETGDELASSQPRISGDGRAVVIASPGRRRLEEGWVAEYELGSDRLTATRPESIERYRAWRSGTLSFRAAPLYTVVRELNRYSRKKILIEDASVMELNVYATVGIDEIDAALNGLEELLPIQVTRHYDRIVISGSQVN
ncbi:MAG: FecR domain-containing protein [Gammaproteobacteria bacterium]|nr:FecR domain-containing protein [Gammaproteobacteria bacterium]